MEKEFVTYAQALALQELGVYIQPPVYCCYQKTPVLMILPSAMTTFDIIAPLKSQVFRWFREKYNIVSEINVYSTTDGYAFSFKILCKKYTPFIDADDAWTTYEEVENACIDELIEIAKQK